MSSCALHFGGVEIAFCGRINCFRRLKRRELETDLSRPRPSETILSRNRISAKLPSSYTTCCGHINSGMQHGADRNRGECAVEVDMWPPRIIVIRADVCALRRLISKWLRLHLRVMGSDSNSSAGA
jgi:hypothetical protein